MPQNITVPDIGDFKDVEVIDVLVKAGDVVEPETPLVTLETEKATMDVPSPSAGVIKSVNVKKGDRVSKGSVIVALDDAAGAAPSTAAPSSSPPKEKIEAPAASEKTPEKKPEAPAAPAAAAKPSPPPASASTPAASKPAAVTPPIDEAGFATAHASPSVRKFAREIGVDLARVKGSGIKGRITPEDVKAWVKQALSSTVSAGKAGTAAGPVAAGSALPTIPVVDFASYGAIEVKPLGRIQKISGPRLHASWVNVPHVWQMEEADITELEATRKSLKAKTESQGIKVTPLAFILRACVKALQQFPQVNASLDPGKQNLILKKYIHLGFAADTPNGLMVPVIQNADRKDIYEIARDLGALSEKARAGKLSAAEMSGGSFTVSSLGGIGGTSFTPIINAPEVAILGVARSAMKPVYIDGKFEPRLILPFTFAYDHRVIDGATAARFVVFLADALRDPKSLLEAVP